jgi:uncharacterized membrane protein
MPKTIGNPLSWTAQTLAHAGQHVGASAAALGGEAIRPEDIRVNALDGEDIRHALRRGLEDFGAFRSYVIFLCLIYPVAGLLLAWGIYRQELLPLLFPLVSGFALLGPVASVGLMELSRQREAGLDPGWGAAFAPFSSPSFGAILVLSLYLGALFVLWMVAAYAIYLATLGPEPPASLSAFAADVLTTPAGWAMIVAGFAVGFLFAAAALVAALVSFPLVLDRHAGVPLALATSLAVVRRNPRAAATWGLVVAAALVIGALPALLGLALVVPVLGHATWHLYRRAVTVS